MCALNLGGKDCVITRGSGGTGQCHEECLDDVGRTRA